MNYRHFALLVIACVGCAPANMGSVSQRQQSATQSEEQVSGNDAQSQLLKRIDRVLVSERDGRLMTSERNAAWQIMHGVVCYGESLPLGTPDRGTVGALEYAFSGGLIRGLELMPSGVTLASTGREGLKARLEPGSYEGQGHVDQWVAICAMADVPLSTSISVGEREFTLEDFVRQAQYDVPNNLLNEFSWSLIALTHYFPDEPEWEAAGDLIVSWEDLVQEELLADIDSSPCGGTHRLVGIVKALRAKERLGLQDSETWTEATALVERLFESAKEHRGPEGGLSSNYFYFPGAASDLTAQLSSSGHLFEFLAQAASNDELREPWLALAAENLCSLFESTRHVDMDCGALYHGLNGLRVYRLRMNEITGATSGS